MEANSPKIIMKTWACLLLGLVLQVSVVKGAERHLPIKNVGQNADVTLCQISEISATNLTGSFEGQKFGIEFILLVEKSKVDEASFGLQELKDFSVAGVSYRELSSVKTSSVTVVNDPEEFVEELERWEMSFPKGRALVLTVRIAGDEIPLKGDVSISQGVAWGREGLSSLERFSFTVPASEIRKRTK